MHSAKHDGRSTRTPPLDVVCAISLGGAVGALARWSVSEAFPVVWQHFPWSTYAENVSGALLLGFAVAYIQLRRPRSRLIQPFLSIGVLGSFTTFSNFSHEALALAMNDRAPLAIWYMSSSILCGLLAASFGILLGRALGQRGHHTRNAS